MERELLIPLLQLERLMSKMNFNKLLIIILFNKIINKISDQDGPLQKNSTHTSKGKNSQCQPEATFGP